MARKEVNIFGTSFLDLLSGALGAVIILFIIVPKMSVQQQEALHELEELNIQVDQLEDLMEQVENSVSQDVYEQLEQQVEEMRTVISSLASQVERLQTENASLRSENQNIREQYDDARSRIRELENHIEELEAAEDASGGMIFGVNAETAIVCMWPEDVDVDLYVKNMMNGDICYYNNKNFSWGNLLEDVRSHEGDDGRYELFYQQIAVPGEYQVYVNIYHVDWDGTSAVVNVFAVMHPGKSNQKRVDFRTVRLTQSGKNEVLGILKVTDDNIYLR